MTNAFLTEVATDELDLRGSIAVITTTKHSVARGGFNLVYSQSLKEVRAETQAGIWRPELKPKNAAHWLPPGLLNLLS